MKFLARCLLSLLLILLLLAGADQYLVHAAPESAPFSDVRRFYLDFRARLLSLPHKRPHPSPATKPANDSPARFVYVDGNGDIQFAGGLEEVPPRYRREARPLVQ